MAEVDHMMEYFEEVFDELKRVNEDTKFKQMPHMTAPIEELILELLREHEHFKRPVKALQQDTFGSQYCGEMSFEIETRFGFLTLHVFNDCGEWDYLERVTFQHVDYYYPSMSVSSNRPWMTNTIKNWKPLNEMDPRWGEPSF